MRYRPSVFIVAYYREKKKILYLLLKRKLHWKGWEFPKGGVEVKEEIKKAIAREIKEETGRKAENIKEYELKGSFDYDKNFKDRPGFDGQSWSLFSAEIKNRNIKIDKKEHSDYKWLEFEKAEKMLRWPNQKVCLNYVNKKLK